MTSCVVSNLLIVYRKQLAKDRGFLRFLVDVGIWWHLFLNDPAGNGRGTHLSGFNFSFYLGEMIHFDECFGSIG